MVKEKKGKKGNKEEEIVNDSEVNQKNKTGPDMSKSKKRDRKKNVDWEDDVANEIASLALQEKNEDATEKIDEPIIKPKEKKKTRKNERNEANEKISASKSTIEKDDSQEDDYEKNSSGDGKDKVPEVKSKSSIRNNKKKDIKMVQETSSDEENEKMASSKKTKPKEVKKAVKFSATNSVFELLVDEGMDNDNNDSDDDNESDVDGRTNKNEEKIIENDLPERTKEEKGSKKSKKEQKKKQEEEEIERMMAEIELGGSKKTKPKQKEETQETEEKGESGASKKNKLKQKEEAPETEEKGLTIVAEIPDEEEDKPKKRKKKKAVEEEKSVEKEQEDAKEKDENEEEFSLKTSAQKKKEKKEREKQKKLAQKTQQKKSKEDVKTEDEKETDINIKAEPQKQEEPLDKQNTEELKAEDDEEDDGKKSKKDKKKKKVDKDKDDKDKKRPGKKQILAMQETLKKIKEEEEKRRLEEEEKQKAAEEAERLRQEKIRLALERKEKRKQKEKEKRERLKAEGKLLTQSQKQQRARAQAMLESLRAQGIDVPKIGEKKERIPRPGDRIRSKKPKQDQGEGQENEESKESTPEANTVQDVVDSAKDENQEEEKAENKEIVTKEIEESIKDAWDESSGGEEDDDEEAEKQIGGTPTDSKVIIEVESKKGDETDEEESKMSESESDEESGSESEGESESESESEDEQKTTSERIRERAYNRIQKRRETNEKYRNMDKLRSPVVCVLGHVDTGKTKILDKIRHTHVQDSEAGGITQQIGATMVPVEAIGEQCKMVKNFSINDLKIPGLLIIDTPGHESFSNLRSRGSSLCDIAILVVDIMHGLEPQTIESINLLKQKKTPFLVALNKIDRLYEWKQSKNKDVQETLKSQNRNTHLEFEERCKSVILQFAEQGLNATLFYENKDPRTFISLVPTSAMSGDGMGNLIALVVELTQTMMAKRLAFSEELQATVLEVKAVPGLGTTIDVILVNGRMKEGDTLILAGIEGPLVTQIRSLLMPQPLKELRVKNPYQEYKEVEGAQGVKVTGKDLDKAIAGLNLLIAQHHDEVEILKEEVAKELQAVMNSIKLAERGVYVQASTLGSLEALLEFLATSKIPYSGIRIGPVVKKDVMKASIMLEHDNQYAVILAFDVKIERDAQELADSLGVKIFSADIIYHLFDKFTAYREELRQKKRDQFKHVAVFPCRLRILPQFIFNTRDPIVVGVSVEAGVVREGTPLCVPTKEFLEIGIVSTIEVNHKPMESARKGQEVCIKIENVSGETPKLYGRHFDYNDQLVSKISRQSIDACKEYFRDDLQKSDWQLMVELKKLFKIM